MLYMVMHNGIVDFLIIFDYLPPESGMDHYLTSEDVITDDDPEPVKKFEVGDEVIWRHQIIHHHYRRQRLP
jgi:hypothetical protein